MEDIDLEQQNLLNEIEELEWNSRARECVDKCEIYLKKYPHCKKVIPSYAHMYQFVDYVKATHIAKNLYDEQPDYYKNTYIYVYLLQIYDCRGRDDIQNIYYRCSRTFIGEKDIYFYLTHAITAIKLLKQNKSLNILSNAMTIFQNDKFEARLYYHYALTVGDVRFLTKSIEVQPNFDFNYIYKGIYYADNNLQEDALIMFQKAIDINPLNYQGLLFLAIQYDNMGNQEEAKKLFDKYLKIRIFIPSQLLKYLEWRVQQGKKKNFKSTEKIPIDIIKVAYQFDFLDQDNFEIFNQFIIGINFFSDTSRIVSDTRDLIMFYMQMSIRGYLKIYSSSDILKLALPFFQESDQCLKSILNILAYQKQLNNENLFQQKYIIWDLFID